jgi:BirA family biotin operon repressor/biotin-[acetyl-CoA-carboxylase] ligase
MPETGRGFRGGALLRFGRIPSTMDAAREQPDSELPVTVVASEQTAGRGRFDRNWVSPPEGGLYLTVRIPWTRPIQQAPLVSIGAALALARVAAGIGCRDIVLKWPNDLLIGGRKAAGILAEMASGSAKQSLLVGVGINVSIPASTLSTVGQPAVSLSDACGSPLDPERILSEFLGFWSELDSTLETNGFAPLAREFRSRTDLPGRRFLLSSGSDRRAIVVRDIGDDGSLEVQDAATGAIERVFGGELLPVESR